MNAHVKIVLVSAALAGSAAADLIEKDLSRLRLRPQCYVRGGGVTLADVLVFAQADPRLLAEIGDKPALTMLEPQVETEISHDQVVRRLEELGVNLARVLVSGALVCRVTLEPVSSEIRMSAAANTGPLLRAPQTGEGTVTTALAEALRRQTEEEFASAGGTVELEFERASQEYLELTAPPFEFSIRSRRGRRLGVREFTVGLRRDGRLQRTIRVAVNVKLVRQVLVAAKPLNVGTYVRRDSLEHATRVFASDSDLGFEHAEQVVGQRVKRFVPVRQMLHQGDLESVDLVKRSQPVTLIGGDRVSIRVTGDALDSGGYGDTIRVRLGDSRRNRREVRGVVTGVGTARLMDDGL